MMTQDSSTASQLAERIKDWGKSLGFADVGITHTDLSAYEADYFNWVGLDFHGEMHYMTHHGHKRTRPNELVPGTLSIISVRMNYLDSNASDPLQQLHKSENAYISRYALGKDYHKLLRKRLQKLAEKIASEVPELQYRAFTDSAPVLERPIAKEAGLGFIGKNSLIIHPRAGSWFFLGELYTNLQLPPDPPFEKQACGPCTACIQECPTNAIIEDGLIDARRCISYLTIEYPGSIPDELRSLMGNRIYGCDDCQLVCPWNRYSSATTESDFQHRHRLDSSTLLELWQWSEADFLHFLEGSPIRRIGYTQWLRNLAVALGNLEGGHTQIRDAIQQLSTRRGLFGELLDEHIDWALERLKHQLTLSSSSEKNQSSPLKPFAAAKYYMPKSIK
ncbi:tRNA epoxyqueuosine(34) reductase QueG [Thiomicrorhabdus heinhorstiae]|uniref:Epoxyqueuosine reductase n=1 Tax=Thiomicrorhabdus heinhorstiae TaxID=2748010 RepID=A0ABS0BWU4_9GAMM|nr:tRNA epoxyqueuosine(34) reductase QueG [Thiomicrorhabdus heinhorstiae]MBF6058275.1 tRNA epoxyqueuosine(34) reductase QueG [Thiomicrorhabdus heinhorstiae]